MMRDYTGLCAVFIALYGAAGMFAIPSLKVALIYLALLGLQFIFVRQAGSNYGTRMVTTVLARRAGKEVPKPAKVTKPRTRKTAAAAPPEAAPNSTAKDAH